MDKLIFEYLDRDNDSLWIPKEFFNSINTFFFIEVIEYLVKRVGYGNEFSYCEFPDELDYSCQFEGVRFVYQDNESIVSEEEFKECLSLACEKFVAMHPEKTNDLNKILHG